MNGRPGESTGQSRFVDDHRREIARNVSPPTRDVQSKATLHWYDPGETRHFRLDPFTGLYTTVSSIPAMHQLVRLD